jgi:DNA-binding transcriptional MerR regulator
VVVAKRPDCAYEFDFERTLTSTVVVVSSNPDRQETRCVSIAEASQRTGLSRHTLRYYERAGLIEPVERSTSGRRQYEAGDLDWFAFLVRLRQTGMPIAQMQQFAQLRADGIATLEKRRQLLDEHRRHVEAAIAVQQDHLAALDDKITHYDQLIGEPGDQK